MTTPKLQLPELVVGQSGKELTHNQALAILSQLTQANVIDKDLTAPPASPADGAMYLVATSATGAWLGKDGQLAFWLTSVAAWTFIVPVAGWIVWVADEARRYEFLSGVWVITATGSGGDILSELSSPEVSVTGEATLTAAAFGKMHVCSGTTADYTVYLPAVSGNAGKIIGVRCSQALTKLVSIDANGSELIDGKLKVILNAGCSAVFLCDGSGWSRIANKSFPVFVSAYQSTAQSIPNSTVFTKVNLQTKLADTHLYFDASTSRFNPKIAGRYMVTGGLVYQPHTEAESGKILVLSLYKNGSRVGNFAVSAFTSSTSSGATGAYVVDMNGSTDYVELFTAQGGTGALDLQAVAPTTFLQAILLGEI